MVTLKLRHAILYTMHRGPIGQSIHKFRELLLEPVNLYTATIRMR